MQTTNKTFLVLINTPCVQGESTSESFRNICKETRLGEGICNRTSCSECRYALEVYSHVKMNLTWFITEQ